ncbi:alpha/beta hydrolase fold domain-containing protein [Aeromicrobium sp. 636]|uniref:Alpha/beta hydrolase fold domain-containing protein n=1 Tax=Aeromicrobium senzhongii TaxID=2663859 RepID=A0A8I0EUG4_9ACTN|nr:MULTISPECIES: alpha/beta hydrolase fold domain-containing protein [Aeromicrobium]MBC9225567.1 alpha/beta hydrolase fold domain-containing protein [Aeromicrobium senzhongii]MCQ3997677.1 alpha/beta hydrolase fold domain-containing protein [Aeromicrobium sp. 636]MTB87604.1 alpha/beta hydrolase fold domain-containing protein [Aeromicrobium senzhongii]QNL95358.1 alpha/beta hydrolase fold domain-containing protein [Aeromicrobium senzhongii]
MVPDDMPPRLRSLVERALAAQAESPTPPLPDPEPAPGETREDWERRVARVRAQHDALALETAARYGFLGDRDDPVGSIGYVDIPVEGGTIAARVYRPIDPGDRPPAIVVLHGGGWWMGGGAQGYRLGDGTCRMLCHGLGAVVLNVDYRLAPEFRFPVQLHDARDVVAWLRRGAGPQVDPDRVAVAGTSSGGHLAAALTLLLKDEGEQQLAMQVLVAPAVDLAEDPAGLEDPQALRGIETLRRYYAGDAPNRAIPYLSPLRAPDLSGLPPAVVVTGDFDPLTAPALDYVERLREAGVRVDHVSAPVTHTIGAQEDWRAAEEQILAACRELL